MQLGESPFGEEGHYKINIANNTKSNPKEFYTYIRNKKMITTNSGSLHLENGKVTNTESEIA